MHLTRRSALRSTLGATLGTALGAGLAAGGSWALAGCGGSDWRDARGRLRIAAGNTGAVFDAYGRALAAEAGARMPGVRADALQTPGSVSNVLAVAEGEADVGFCLGDTALLALAGDAPFDRPLAFSAVTRLYDSFLQLLVPRDSPIRSVRDLAGRRLTAGEAASGTRIAMSRTLRTVGLGPDDVEFRELSLGDAVRALQEGEVDALGFVSGFPIPALVELGRGFALRAIDLGDRVDALVRRHGAQYVAGPLPRGPYSLEAGVRTVSIKTYMVASPALSDDLAYGLSAVIFEQQAEIARRVPQVRQPTYAAGIFTQPVALHPGSLRYFRDRDQRGA